jgi:sec-independent protein translocase protein TatA
MLSIPHLIIIFVVALVVFGPQKLPELARNLGKIMAEFRRATGDLRSTFDEHMRELERESQAIEQRKRELEVREAALRSAQSSALAHPPVAAEVTSEIEGSSGESRSAESAASEAGAGGNSIQESSSQAVVQESFPDAK